MKTRVYEVIKRTMVEPFDFDDSTPLGMIIRDSLDTVEIVYNLEDEFHCSIEESEIFKLSTVGDLVKLIEGIDAIRKALEVQYPGKNTV